MTAPAPHSHSLFLARPTMRRTTPKVFSIFRRLPRPVRHDELMMVQRSSVTVARGESPRTTPIVFVVDDDISVRESLELLLRSEGWQPQLFASAEEFLSRPQALVPSCLLLDMNLPHLNGLDLQKRIAA